MGGDQRVNRVAGDEIRILVNTFRLLVGCILTALDETPSDEERHRWTAASICALTLIKKLNRCALLNRISGRVFSLKPNGMPLP